MAIDLQVLLGLKPPRKRDYSQKLWFVPFNMTFKCDLNCSFCYGKNRPDAEMTTEDIKTFIIDNVADSTAKWIGFTGGDPLIRPDCLDLMSYAKDAGLNVILSTNGVNLSSETINALSDLDITRIGIGISDLHDRYDCIMGGHYFDKVDTAIKTCVDQGFDVSLRAVPTKLNHERFMDLVDYAASQGVYKFCKYNMIYAGQANPKDDITESQKDTMVIDLLNKQMEHSDLKIWLMERPYDNIVLSRQGYASLLKALNYGKCGAAKALLNIAPNGDMYPCPYFAEIMPPIGNARVDRIRDIALSDIRIDMENNLEAGCRDCENADICGGCRFHALKYGTNILGGDPFCRQLLLTPGIPL